MRRTLLVVAAAAAAYLGLGALLHFVVFPEPAPPHDDRPERGTRVRLPGGSSFIFRQTAAETDGALFEAEWIGEPGAGTPRHTHPSQEERLRIEAGELRLVSAGRERRLGPGEQAVVPAGVAHRWENPGPGRARGVFQLRPAGRADFVFVQLDRAFAGEAGPFATAIQTFILIGTHGEHTAWPIETLRLLVAPTARLFGFRSYYEPPAGRPSRPAEPGSLRPDPSR